MSRPIQIRNDLLTPKKRTGSRTVAKKNRDVDIDIAMKEDFKNISIECKKEQTFTYLE